MGKTVNIGQLREPINIVSYAMISDGVGGFIQDGEATIIEVFSSWKQTSTARKLYMGLDADTNYFTVIIRSMDISKSAYIEKDGDKYSIKDITVSQNLSSPDMMTLTVSKNE